jgi:hypothetical protein
MSVAAHPARDDCGLPPAREMASSWANAALLKRLFLHQCLGMAA